MAESSSDAVTELMQRINHLWLTNQVSELAPLLHPDIVMVLPGFSGRIRGRVLFLASFRQFCENARIGEFRERDQQIDLVGKTAVVSFCFEMTCARGGERFHATGRDFWIFEEQESNWLAVWRTMLEMEEAPLSPTDVGTV